MSQDRHGAGTWSEAYRFVPVPLGDAGPTPGVLVPTSPEESLDDRCFVALATACEEAGGSIELKQAAEIVQVIRESKTLDAAQKWIQRNIPADRPDEFSRLQRIDGAVVFSAEE